MPIELALAKRFKQGRWKVKIRDKERPEPPQVSIIQRSNTWRLCLRDGKFRDSDPDPANVPAELVQFIKDGRRPDGESVWQWLCDPWDVMYPENRVGDGE